MRGGVGLTREEKIDIMIEVMSDLNLHLRAFQDYKHIGTTVALNGKEDHLISRQAKDFENQRRGGGRGGQGQVEDRWRCEGRVEGK